MRDRLLEFELALDRRANQEVVAYEWGEAFLSPSLPMAWDANWVLVKRAGMTATEVLAVADESLRDYAHRAVAIMDEAEGARLAPQVAELPGWESEQNLYMVWRGEGDVDPNAAVLETPLAGCAELRRELICAEFPSDMPDREETTDQLLEMNRRLSAAAGDRWFVSPPEQPASACCLLSGEGIGQVEDVGTLPSCRGRGHAQAVIRAALAASRRAEHDATFIVADAEDWPRLLYEKLGFEPCGVLHVLRRAPTPGITA